MGWLREALDNVPDVPGRVALKRWGVPKGLRRMILFWQVSVTGWLIDVGLLTLLVHLGVPVFLAACLAPVPALTWTFVLSTYKIYFREKGFSRTRFIYFLLFNLEMMLVYGWVVSEGVKAGYLPVTVKLALAPVTFIVNFFFTKLLLKQKSA